MKVYQCIHKYPPHIVYFEEKNKNVISKLSFNELRDLIIKDGYANTYILNPALEGRSEEVFYTLWDYETLQFKWAEENGLKTKNLDEIKLAQIEEFKPDVFYNHSPYYDGGFIQRLESKKNLIKVCWDAIITNAPSFHENYDIRFSLFEPYIKYWNQCNYNAYILPPAFPTSWELLQKTQKNIDILFYGQYEGYFFSERNKILQELAEWSKHKGYNFELHLQFNGKRRPLIDIKGFRKFTKWIPVASKIIRDNALPPIYGQQLYETIARSRIVINAFTNYNGLFKDNMRNYESIGCGAFLISEDGIYPEHFIPNNDLYTYRNTSELFTQIDKVFSLQDKGASIARETREKLKKIYSKENQWNKFLNAINT